MEEINKTSDVELIDSFVKDFSILKNEIGRVIVGQDEIIEKVLISIFSRGHCLLVGVPGLAKTLLVNTISEVLGLTFNRIQFTPDLMPSDIIGSDILDENRNFRFIKGPLFANIILADEINRTPPKTQSALLEAMQEESVTTGGNRYELSKPFFVLATQNPIEQEGTYPLPEAQLDRFMFNLWLDYPSRNEEVNIVKSTTSDVRVELNEVLSGEQIMAYQRAIRQLPVTDPVIEYAVKLAASSRPGNPDAPEITNQYLSWGAGPRASQYLIVGAKCHAALRGKYAPDIEDVKAVAVPIFRHRLVRNYKAEADRISTDEIISKLLEANQ
jgi:MoxR-like ATPase